MYSAESNQLWKSRPNAKGKVGRSSSLRKGEPVDVGAPLASVKASK